MSQVIHVRARSQKNNVTSLYILLTKSHEDGDLYGYDITQSINEDLKKDKDSGFERHHGRAFAWGVTQACDAGRVYLDMKRRCIAGEEDKETPMLYDGWWRTIKEDRIEEILETWVG